jgi:hypothetical protein
MTDPTNLDAPVTTADLSLSVQMLSHVLNGALGPVLAPNLNPELLLGNHPTAQPVEDCAGCGRAPQQAHTYFCVECEAAAIASHRAVRDSEPDGPIREPGDDVHVRSNDELFEALTERAGRSGTTDLACLLLDAANRIDDLDHDVKVLRKAVGNLAGEKMQAQNWIANLRQTNELYGRTIAEQNAQLAALGVAP